MVKKDYVPERGDIVWIEFSPQVGHEQIGRRPAVVVSPKKYNAKAGLALFCPITSVSKGYPFEVLLPKNSKIKGVILADQIKSLDFHARKTKFILRLPDSVIGELMEKGKTLLE